MSSIVDRYYKINRILLKALGIWPYQNSKWTHVQALIITSIYLSVLFVQLAVFVTHECTLKIIVDVLSFVFPTVLMLFLYDLFYFNTDFLKEVLDHLSYDWEFIRSEEEFIIMDDHASTAKIFTHIFLFLSSIGISVMIMSHIPIPIPTIIDVLLPLNLTRTQGLHLIVEYFVDPSKYFTLILIHLTISICLGVITITSTSLMLLGIGFHCCALFKLANYRMEIIMDQNILRIPSPEKEQIIYKRMIRAIDIHCRAFELCEYLVMNMQKWFLVIIVVGVTSLSINLLRFLEAITNLKIVELKVIDLFLPGALVFTHFCYLFFSNHIGQRVADNNDSIFNTIYNLPWYIAPLNVQKLLIFLLQKGTKTFYLSLSGLFDASYQGFTSLSMTSISYFTVLYSIQ
ncbi:hypothetical protein DMN91_009870 [Ooceraea biroi]|uniref:Odorant receptor n=1 Tax=Ooceraea biroi TaxID=2015173 RepID=A0A026VX73_OOCBI|nr:hypothetical protein X777_14144 [Ooceraea biroi]RLU17634.1 hypothetical protein DMN91_009870 [Ooceraea biroi]